jgi:acetyltransferase-like isoleucine patch superfamily enzyme
VSELSTGPGLEGLAACGDGAIVYSTARIIRPEALWLGDHSTIDDFVFLNAGRRTRIGRFVHVAAHASVIGGGELDLGDFAVVATGARILTATDSPGDGAFMTTHVADELRCVIDEKVTVGAHGFVGANAVVLPGVTIGEGAVVGAGGVVTRDLEPWTIYAGVPVRAIGQRTPVRHAAP